MVAVVTKYASGAYDPSVQPRVPLPAEETQGHLKQLTSTVEIANGDALTSVVHFGKLPSTARLGPESRIACDAITGLTDFDLGDPNHVDALVNGADLHAALSNVAALSAVDIASWNKPLWQVLGYADDPGGEIDIIGTLNASATAAGTLTLHLVYATP